MGIYILVTEHLDIESGLGDLCPILSGGDSRKQLSTKLTGACLNLWRPKLDDLHLNDDIFICIYSWWKNSYADFTEICSSWPNWWLGSNGSGDDDFALWLKLYGLVGPQKQTSACLNCWITIASVLIDTWVSTYTNTNSITKFLNLYSNIP